MFRWAIKGRLARGRRPGLELKRGSQVPKTVVDAWIRDAKEKFGVRSVICSCRISTNVPKNARCVSRK